MCKKRKNCIDLLSMQGSLFPTAANLVGYQGRRWHGLDGFGRTHQFSESGSRTHQFLRTFNSNFNILTLLHAIISYLSSFKKVLNPSLEIPSYAPGYTGTPLNISIHWFHLEYNQYLKTDFF